MDVINVPNEEKEIEIPESILTNMLADDYNAWLQIAREGRITKRLLKNLQKCHSMYFYVIRSMGLEQFKLSDEELEKIIDYYIVYLCCRVESLRAAITEVCIKKQRTTLKHAINESILKTSNNEQGE